MARRVWFFRSKQDQSDAYAKACHDMGYEPCFIPVLDFKTESIPVIRDMLEQGPSHHGLGGVIVTSQRSVAALTEALSQAKMDSACVEAWRALPVYVVGPKTSKSLQSLACFPGNAEWLIADTANDLANAMDACRQRQQRGSLLFLAGDKRRDVLPHRLQQQGWDLCELRSYATCASPHLASRLSAITWRAEDWVVYFSPSGVDYVGQVSGVNGQFTHIKIAAIGPTTADHLARLQVPVHAVAHKPCAADLMAAVYAYDNRQKNTHHHHSTNEVAPDLVHRSS